MSRITGRAAAVAFGLLSFSLNLAGCGPSNELGRVPLSGTVTLDGQPLDSGSVSFDPIAGAGTRSGTTVTDGRFEIPELKGLPPGRYRVRLSAAAVGTAPPPEDLPPGMSGPAHKERIPKSWNVRSEQEIEVTADGQNIFTFDVKSSG